MKIDDECHQQRHQAGDDLPNTSSRMMSAAGRPNWSSPFCRSPSESTLKS